MTASGVPDVTIGTVVAAFGIKGELKVRIDTDFPERFEEIESVWVQPANGAGRVYGIDSVRFHQGMALLKLEGVDDRNASEEMRGAELRISREERKKLETDEFYIDDLIGVDVYTTEGEHLGKVTEVLKGVANDTYVTPRGMIPGLKQFVKEIDLAGGKMVVAPEGVFE